MLHKRRIRRPYQRKRISKAGALIFGVGLAALLTTVFILSSAIIPDMQSKVDNLAYRARTYYRKLIPHPKFLPAPASQPQIIIPQTDVTPLLLNIATIHTDPLPAIAPATPVALTLQQAEVADEENLLLPDQVTTESTITNSLAESIQLNGFFHQWQTWNNCGPATITTYMSYFGRGETQADAALFLKPNRDDKNVTPQELINYVHSIGLGGMVRQGGSVEKLKLFLNNDIPVLVETWLIHDGDGLGHYRLITGYDDTTQQFMTADSLNGPSHTVDYAQFDADWRVFNRLYVVIYETHEAQAVTSIIGPDLDTEVMYNRLLAESQAEIEANPNDPIAFFNQGEVLTRLGRYEAAVTVFDQARELGLHWRRLWYQFTPFEAYYATGRYQDVIDLTSATLKSTGGLEEAYFYQGLAQYALGQPEAQESFAAALAYNQNFLPAQDALRQIQENN